MSEGTNIQWADDTWNPWRGCAKVSPGCKNCYAEKVVKHRLASTHYEVATSGGNRTSKKFLPTIGGHSMSGFSLWGEESPRIKAVDFNAPLRWNKKPWVCNGCGNLAGGLSNIALEDFICSNCDWQGFHRRRVFTLSLGDWLDDEVPSEWLAEMLDVIRRCPNLDFLMLTKRVPNLFERVALAMNATLAKRPVTDEVVATSEWLEKWLNRTPPANVWFGFSAEDQKRFDERWKIANKIPTQQLFVSFEPLLGPINLPEDFWQRKPWGIWGGESGPGARPCNIEWIRAGVRQFRDFECLAFVKQLGANIIDRNDAGFDGDDGEWPMDTHYEELDTGYQGAPVRVLLKDKKGGDMNEWPEDLRVREFPCPA